MIRRFRKEPKGRADAGGQTSRRGDREGEQERLRHLFFILRVERVSRLSHIRPETFSRRTPTIRGGRLVRRTDVVFSNPQLIVCSEGLPEGITHSDCGECAKNNADNGSTTAAARRIDETCSLTKSKQRT